jgi:hypothetical protein
VLINVAGQVVRHLAETAHPLGSDKGKHHLLTLSGLTGVHQLAQNPGSIPDVIDRAAEVAKQGRIWSFGRFQLWFQRFQLSRKRNQFGGEILVVNVHCDTSPVRAEQR